MVGEEPALRYDAERHEYIDAASGVVLPSVTQLLIKDGKVDPTWFTEEGRRRGTEVHRLTLNYDLDVYDDVKAVDSPHKGYLLAWAALSEVMQRPAWDHLEEPFVHHALRFGGTPDRVGIVWRLLSLGEIKTGDFEKWHPLQTALQAILVARTLSLRPEMIVRFAFYLKENGRYKVEEHVDHAADFREARKILRKWCDL